MKNKRLLNVGLIVLVVMPAVASYLLGAFGTSVPGWLASRVMFFVVSFAYFKLISKPGVVTVE